MINIVLTSRLSKTPGHEHHNISNHYKRQDTFVVLLRAKEVMRAQSHREKEERVDPPIIKLLINCQSVFFLKSLGDGIWIENFLSHGNIAECRSNIT